MKLDYDLIKEIMLYIESNSDGENEVWVDVKDLPLGCSQEKIDYHLNILGDDDLLILGNYGGLAGSLPVYRLTAEGHRVLETIKNDNLWNKIKADVLDGGRGELKNIPALVIKLILTGSI